jgi:hypothetical protein
MKRMPQIAALLAVLVVFSLHLAFSQDAPLNQAPAGFVNLFNGKDLTNWRGRQQDYSPHLEALLSPSDLAAKQVEWNTDRDQNWSVDAAKGELVSDGKGVFLVSPRLSASASLGPR